MKVKINKVYIDLNKVWAMSELEVESNRLVGYINGCKLSTKNIPTNKEEEVEKETFITNWNKYLEDWKNS